MAEPKARVIDGMKFMWDGREYVTKADSEKAKSEYEKANFEVRVLEEAGKFSVYSRRVVKQTATAGAPPA